MNHQHPHMGSDGFRLRGHEMSRIDGFSDVVFGFALTLIVVSLEVPRTYGELHQILLGFIPFCICFVFFIMVWWAHFRFFRRFNLHDPATIIINAALLFTVLFYVYPLKFLFVVLYLQIFGQHVSEAGAHEAVRKVFETDEQVRELMMVYGAGFAATYFCLSALYVNAFRQRVHLHLNELEAYLTKTYAGDLFGVGCVGVTCCVLALLLPPARAGWAPSAFLLIGVFKTIHGTITGRRGRRFRDTLPADVVTAPLPRH